MTVDLFPNILANVVDIQKERLLLHTPVLNKMPRLSSARMFVRLYRLRLIHCIYVSVTKPTCPAFSAWLNTGSTRSFKVTGKAIISVVRHYHQSYVQHYTANLIIVQCMIARHAEVWTCPFCWKFYKELTVTMVHVPERAAVSTQSQHYAQYKEGHDGQSSSFTLSSG